MAGKNQASQTPTAFGSMLQASTYGMTIPVVCGRTLSPLLAIWANNLRQGGSTKKFKQMKKGITAYTENIDFLLGYNPIFGVLQMWNNGAKYPLNFVTYSTAVTSGGSASVTISDANFYAVIGVTLTQSYSQAVNDYGAAGSSTLSGAYEVPLWNASISGPDPTAPSAMRNFPFIYRWQPSDGATIYLDNLPTGAMPSGTLKIYYAQLVTSGTTPLSKNRLHFEATLGDGDEYNGFTSQQILYPQFAGCGSASIDLGSAGAIPSLKAEVHGKYGIYPTGDCDYVDIIEDVIKSGIQQSAIGGSASFSGMQHGMAASDYPGVIQRNVSSSAAGTVSSCLYPLPTTAGNFLVVLASTGSTTAGLGISDTSGCTWTAIFAAGQQFQAWYAPALGGASEVSVTGLGNGSQVTVLEVAGLDNFDGAVVGSSGAASISTTNVLGYPGFILGLGLWDDATAPNPPSFPAPGWNFVLANDTSSPGASAYHIAASRGTIGGAGFSLQVPSIAGSLPAGMALLAFKCSNPPTYPKPIGSFLDSVTAEQTRMQCRAGGLWGSLAMTAQKTALEWLKDLTAAANCAPVYSGFRLKLVPRSEASAAGNGAIYISPTAAGPVADLDADKGDFVASKDESPIVVIRTARADLDTVLQMQHLSRASDYAQTVTAETDTASVAKWGVRKADPILNNAIQDPAIARALLRIAIRRRNYVENLSYQFTLNARWQHLEAMDLVTITDRQQGIIKVPVRLTHAEDDASYQLQCEAEPFVYGLSAPQQLTAVVPAPYRPAPDVSAGNVNAPIIFEPVPRLYGAQNQAQLWLVISSSNANYGGCQVMISTDGGLSYNPAGSPVIGNATTGATVGSWAGASSPDTTHDLAVDLTESLGTLDSYQVADEDNFVYPCYVAGTSSPIPYELMTYATATMTAANKYTLKATGTGNHLDRGVFGAPTLGVGATHAGGSRFALLPPSGDGILKMTMDPLWIGTTLYFKILSFNKFGGAVQSLSDVTAYTYTPTGAPGAVNPTGVPPQLFLVNGI